MKDASGARSRRNAYGARDASARGMARRRSWARIEDLIVYVSLIVVGAIPVGSALVRKTGLGAEPTIGLVMIGLGLLGLTYLAWSRRDRSA